MSSGTRLSKLPFSGDNYEFATHTTAIALFGFESGAALATVVGVLIEVPVMLLVVRVVNRTRGWYERRAGVPTYEECCPTDLPLHSEH